MAGDFAKGSRAWGHCQRCGFRYFLKDLIHDGQIKGLLVCDDCYDPKHPLEHLPPLIDPMALRHATGDMDAAAANELPAEITLEWSVESVTEVGGTASLSYTNATSPIALSVHWVGDSGGLEFTFDGSTFTLLAGTAEPGEVSATVRATILDAEGKTTTADLPVSATIAEPLSISVIGIAAEGTGGDPSFMWSYGSPNGIEPFDGFPPYATIEPDFQDIYPDWDFTPPLVPEEDSWPNVGIAIGFFSELTTLEITVKMRGAVPDGWSASDSSSANVSISGVVPNGDECVVTVVCSAPEVGGNYTGEISVTADVSGVPHTATINFGFTLAAF